MDLVSRQSLGAYRIERRIGPVAAGELSAAFHPASDEQVLLLSISRHRLSPSARQALTSGTIRNGALRHANIGLPREIIQQGDETLLVFDAPGGVPLEDRISAARRAGRGLPLPEAVDLILGICAAVEHAHRQGVVHGDLRPRLIHARPGGEPVVIGFGLPLLRPQGQPAPDASQDVYQIGALLYEMVTGRAPDPGARSLTLPGRPTAPRLLGCRLPPPVEAVLHRALAPTRAGRFATPASLAQALRWATASAVSSPGNPAAPETGLAPAAEAATPAAWGPVDPPRPGRSAHGVRPFVGSILTGLVAIGLMAALVAWAWGASRGREETSTAIPQFRAGSLARVEVAGGTSASVLRDCPGTFWIGVVGLGTDGDEATVLDRQLCDGDWWYRVTLPEPSSGGGVLEGWLSGSNLVPR